MKVLATKTMAKAIAKAMKKMGVKLEEVSLVKMSEREFTLNVGMFQFDDRDYDWEDGKYKVIQIVYPYEDYAMPCYLSTHRLESLFSRSDQSLDSFMEQVRNEIEI